MLPEPGRVGLDVDNRPAADFTGTAMALLAAAAVAVPAGAHTEGTATGSFAFVSDTQTPIGQAGGNVFIHEVAAISYTGGLTGIADADDIIVVHSDGTLNAYGTETCHSCTIGGRTGSFTGVFAFHGSASGITGREIFVSASGGLAGLHGGGPFEGGPAGNTYSYHYEFTPTGRDR